MYGGRINNPVFRPLIADIAGEGLAELPEGEAARAGASRPDGARWLEQVAQSLPQEFVCDRTSEGREAPPLLLRLFMQATEQLLGGNKGLRRLVGIRLEDQPYAREQPDRQAQLRVDGQQLRGRFVKALRPRVTRSLGDEGQRLEIV